MQTDKIRLACRHYDGTSAIFRGLVKPTGIDLELSDARNTEEMFTRMFKGECDVSEMSLAEYVYYLTRDKCDFAGIPVFPSRLFRHSFILCNASSGIRAPESLDGKRLGFLRWVQTAHIWIRGMLVDDYNISPKNTSWYVTAIHHWAGDDSMEELRPRDGSEIKRLDWQGENSYEKSCLALLEGGLDALAITENKSYFTYLQGDRRIKRLFSNPKEVEADYFRRNRIIPIMHVLVVRNSVVDRYPDLPVQLFELFCQAKRLGREWLRSIPSLGMAWKDQYLEEEKEIFQDDPWAYGLKQNRHAIAKFLSYCHDQGVSARDISPYELFVPSTWDLTE